MISFFMMRLAVKVLEGNPHHVKAFYRRGLAYTAIADFDEARNDFNQVQDALPSLRDYRLLIFMFYCIYVIAYAVYWSFPRLIFWYAFLFILSLSLEDEWDVSWQMIKIDKSSEPDANAALAKLKKREQVCVSPWDSFNLKVQFSRP